MAAGALGGHRGDRLHRNLRDLRRADTVRRRSCDHPGADLVLRFLQAPPAAPGPAAGPHPTSRRPPYRPPNRPGSSATPDRPPPSPRRPRHGRRGSRSTSASSRRGHGLEEAATSSPAGRDLDRAAGPERRPGCTPPPRPSRNAGTATPSWPSQIRWASTSNRSRPQRQQSSLAPARARPSGSARSRLITLGLTLAGLGVAAYLGAAIPLAAYFATALLVLGLSLVAATWLGRAGWPALAGGDRADRRTGHLGAAYRDWAQPSLAAPEAIRGSSIFPLAGTARTSAGSLST